MQKACPPGCCWPSLSSSACWRANRSASLLWRDRWRTWCRTASSWGARSKTSRVTAPCTLLRHPVQWPKVCVQSEAVAHVWLYYIYTCCFYSHLLCHFPTAPRPSKVQQSESKSRKRERPSCSSSDSSDSGSEGSESSEVSAASSEHRRKKHHKDKKRSKKGKDYSRKRGNNHTLLS